MLPTVEPTLMSSRHSPIQVKRPLSKAIIRAIKAPKAPASVGVTMPEYIPPKVIKIRITEAQGLKTTNSHLLLATDLSPWLRPASSGLRVTMTQIPNTKYRGRRQTR